MISERNVIRMRIPFPTINDKLAAQSHMYICNKSLGRNHEFVKCQTLKPYMLQNNTMVHYWDEKPDITRNPFTKPTRIDCDKIFFTLQVIYERQLLTTLRDDVIDDVMMNVRRELSLGETQVHGLNEKELVLINKLIHF